VMEKQKCSTPDMTATYATVKQLTRKVKGNDRKLCVYNLFSSPQKLNHCGSRPNHMEMPGNFRLKTRKWKWVTFRLSMAGDMTAMVCNDKYHAYMLTNITNLPVKGNFCDNSYNTLKPVMIEYCKYHMNFIAESNTMAYSYSYQFPNVDTDKRTVFHIHKLKILTWYILLESYGFKLLTQRLSTDRGSVYSKACWTVFSTRPTTTCRERIRIWWRVGHLENRSHKQWFTTTKSRTDCVVYHAQTKNRYWINTKHCNCLP
jgi:hypothetical protein